MISSWLAGKISGIIIFCVACLSVILLPMMVVQTVRIDGLDLGGWYAVKGYKPLYEAALVDVTTLRGNNAALDHGLSTCNASVDALKKAGDLFTANAQKLIDAANGLASRANANAAAVHAIKATDAKCPSAGAIIDRGFQ